MGISDRIGELGYTGKWIHLMLVGGPGSGKTVMCGTADNGLFITTDPEGTISALAMGSKAKELEALSWKDLSDVYIYLRDGGIKELGLKWVMIDNTSEAQQLGMETTMANARKAKPGLDEFVPTQQDYQRSQNMIIKLVKQFNDLPVNTIWTAWQTVWEDDEGEDYFAPAIHGQRGAIAQMIAGYQNIVGYVQVIEKAGKEVRRVHFRQTGPYRGKDRYMALGQYQDDLTIPKLEAVIKKAVDERLAAKAAGKGAAPRRTRSTSTTKTAPRRRTASTKEK